MDPVADDERLRMREVPSGRRRVMRQVWRHLAFVHWRVDAEAIARLVPAGLHVDTFDGAAYVGIVPFTIPLTRAGWLGAPLAPAFHEINLRTYVHRAGRAPGVWFFSLDATSRLAVAGARAAYALPYFHADIRCDVDGETAAEAPVVRYRARRRTSGRDGDAARCACDYTPAPGVHLAAPGTLELFLVERYLLYSVRRGRLRCARVAHAPYPLQRAALVGPQPHGIDETLFLAAGLPPPVGPPALVHYAREVDVDIFGPQAAG